MEEAHNLSVDLLQHLEEEQCDVGMGAVVFALSLGRLLSPKRLSLEDEMAFLQTALEFTTTYFAAGGVAN